MRRGAALLGSALFLIVAPGTLAGWIPWSITGWRRAGDGDAGAVAGALLISGGLVLLVDCFRRFAWTGRGTPAPLAPTTRLVVAGMYRRVRNPMYVAVTAINLGQALLFSSLDQLAYTAFIWLGFHLFVVLYEEPTLREQFPADHADYMRNVPRWLPRLRAWQDGGRRPSP